MPPSDVESVIILRAGSEVHRPISLQYGAEDALKLVVCSVSHESVAEDTASLVGPHLQQEHCKRVETIGTASTHVVYGTWVRCGVTLQRVSEQPQHPVSEVSRSEHIVRVDVGCEGFPNLIQCVCVCVCVSMCVQCVPLWMLAVL